tara:strand:+ start:6152 stop:7444 length:1293 start_codon:yes stop_codon:yes gene_type:complete
MIERYSRPAMAKVWSESSKYDKWLLVEIAVSEAWSKQGVIHDQDMIKLRAANYNIDRLNEILVINKHEMTAFLSSITENLGPEGRWLHLGLTTSDVWDTATSLQLIESADLLITELENMISVLKDQACRYKETLMMGRTHGVHAEPVTFGLKLALWWDEMRRNKTRLLQAREMVAVGKISGPVGTHATVSPKIEQHACEILGINPAPVSNQIVQRDRHAQFVTTMALISASLEKFSTEIRGLQRTEIREVEEPFGEGQTGSSSMPHKRNPELTERICGLARLIRGHAVTAMENVALWGERDISHSSAERIILPDSCLALDYSLDLLTGVLKDMVVYPDRMKQNMDQTKGLLFSQRVMLTLVNKGLSREKSYGIVQRNARKVWDEGEDFRKLISSDNEVTSHLSNSELEDVFDHSFYVRFVDETFERIGLN